MAKPTATRPTTPRPSKKHGGSQPDVDAILAHIAKIHLDLETLETRRMDGLDFKEQACWCIRDALRAAYEAGRQAASR